MRIYHIIMHNPVAMGIGNDIKDSNCMHTCMTQEIKLKKYGKNNQEEQDYYYTQIIDRHS